MVNITLEEIYEKLSKPIPYDEWKEIYSFYCNLIKINADKNLVSQATLNKIGSCLLDAAVITTPRTNVDYMLAQMNINGGLKK